MNTAENQDWPFDIKPLCPALGAEISGVDLSQVVDDNLFSSIYAAFLHYQVLLFRDQDIPPASQVAFARHFGEVQVHVMNQYHQQDHPELYFLSNLDENGKPNGKHPDRGTLHWHTDGSWRRITGQATIMYSVQVPKAGGETHFCDMYGAYEALADETKSRFSRLRAIHNLDFSRSRRHGEDPMTATQRQQVPPVDHPLVRTHPETRRRCIYLGDHAEHIQGMDYHEGRALVDEINRIIIRPELVYEHRWQPHELVVWDNRCLLHRATAYDTARESRVIRRCTVLGEAPE